ncbi:polysaccharide deacetylase family protein [Clostridium gasigenes]|uniref:polysaccharide deacetylase family protein n=1 Tax=Clostridium gasigenes TaxID=94869 RepID=UPI001C0B1417|nr:polysaccharide deacetylase family protein [Clostridium gasigenes]MBU3131433.1 polysaccharide deacetylase family protein [Clostridium gasigenes]
MKRKNKIFVSLALICGVMISSLMMKNRSTEVFLNITEEQPIFRVEREDKSISLTIDINWAETDYLYSILEVLDKYNVKGTFFIMGGWVNYTPENKEKLLKIYKEGHEVASHSYIHPIFTKIGKDRIKEELDKTDKIIEETIGIKPKLFRFPSGEYNEQSFNTVTTLGYKCIQWDADSVDWKQLGSEVEYQRVMKKVKPGSILLFHNNAKYTPDNLDRIINKLQADGYNFIPVGDLIYNENYYIDEMGEQRKNKY